MEGKSLKQVKQKIDTVRLPPSFEIYDLMTVRFHHLGQGAMRLCTYSNNQLYLHTRASAIVGFAGCWILCVFSGSLTEAMQ